MGIFDSLGNIGSAVLGGVSGPVLGAITRGPKGPNPNNWMPYLQEAKGLWGDARTAEMQRLQDAQASQTAQLAPYAAQFGGMAPAYGQAATTGLEGFQSLLKDPSSILNDSFFKAKLDAGQRAIENSAAAKGMQLSGTNLMDLGNFGANLAADTFGQRLGQFQGLNQIGMTGLGQGLSGLSQIGQLGLGYNQMLNQANYGGISGQTDALGAMAQANSAAAIGKMNAQAQQNSALFGSLGQIGGMAAMAGM